MNTISDISKQYFRTDLPPLKVGEEVEIVTKYFPQNLNEKPNKGEKEKKKFRLTHFKGTIISQKNRGLISHNFAVLKEGSKLAIRSIFPYHSPLIISIKKIGNPQKVHRAKLYYLERELTKKKHNQ